MILRHFRVEQLVLVCVVRLNVPTAQRRASIPAGLKAGGKFCSCSLRSSSVNVTVKDRNVKIGSPRLLKLGYAKICVTSL